MPKHTESGLRARVPLAAHGSSEGFPFTAYEHVLEDAIKVVQDRDAAGRNAFMPFYEQFVHGSKDVSFELHRRATRIVGAERQVDAGYMTADEAYRLKRGDAVDMLNYAAFYLMVLDREQAERGA